MDGEPADLDADFQAVRGTYEDNSFVTDMQASAEQLRERIEQFQQNLSAR